MDKHTIIPAAPGWDAMRETVDEHDNVTALTPDPIIAWLVQADMDEENGPHAFADPITADGYFSGLLRDPYGRILDVGCQSFTSSRAAIDELNQQRRESRIGRERLAAERARREAAGRADTIAAIAQESQRQKGEKKPPADTGGTSTTAPRHPGPGDPDYIASIDG